MCSYENSIAATIRESVTRPDNHIPIRFDIEIEGQKLNDSVLWNINGIEKYFVFFKC